VYAVLRRLGDEGRIVVVAEAFRAHRHARIDDTDRLAEARPVRLD
jgi:hypothetical protein